MTDDREMLELAAKAAGLQVVWHEPDDDSEPWCFIPDCHPPHNRRQRDKESGVIWNPLTDDGDALRLAVKLGLVVESDSKAASSVVRNTNPSWMPEGSWDVHSVNHNNDPLAATRRAITRAAAELGKGMK